MKIPGHFAVEINNCFSACNPVQSAISDPLSPRDFKLLGIARSGNKWLRRREPINHNIALDSTRAGCYITATSG
jgi:hypothetical protein